MIVYLSKKIAIPNKVPLYSLAWNLDHGWISCGGENGLLKVLRLDTYEQGESGSQPTTASRQHERGIAAPSNISSIQTLEGHQAPVTLARWNEQHARLTSADKNGLIIVWSLYKNAWFEEMVNSRENSSVNDMQWTADGERICIAYNDGHVIVGSVDGNRLWGKTLATRVQRLAWSPDGGALLFISPKGELYLYDGQGNEINSLKSLLPASAAGQATPVALDWYDGTFGHLRTTAPTLCVAFSNGFLWLARNETDASAKLINTGLHSIECAKWSPEGAYIAAGGSRKDSKYGPEVLLLDSTGATVRTLRLPGTEIRALAWESTGLRLAIAADSHIYFANIRRDYKWAAMGNTLVYAYSLMDGTGKFVVVFWNIVTGDRRTRIVHELQELVASESHCFILSRQSDSSLQARSQALVAGPGASWQDELLERGDGSASGPTWSGIHTNTPSSGSPGAGGNTRTNLTATDALAGVIATKTVDSNVLYAAANAHVLAYGSGTSVCLWDAEAASRDLEEESRIEPAPLTSASKGPISSTHAGLSTQQLSSTSTMNKAYASTHGVPSTVWREIHFAEIRQTHPLGARTDEGVAQASCIALSSDALAVGFNDGFVHVFSRSLLAEQAVLAVGQQPSHISLNCDGTRALVATDTAEVLLFPIEQRRKTASVNTTPPTLQRKETWCMRWSKDDPLLFCIMEKARMYVYRDMQAEEPLGSAAFPFAFENMTISSVHLDEIMDDPENPDNRSIVRHEVKSLRDTRSIIAHVGIKDALAYVKDHPHVQLWKILGQGALQSLDLDVAERSFIHASDYYGVLTVQRMRSMVNRQLRLAEASVYARDFDNAERLFKSADRTDLAVDMRAKIGDWFNVAKLAKAGFATESTLAEANFHIGEYYQERGQWVQAAQYFSACDAHEPLISCLYLAEDYHALEMLAARLPDNSPHLPTVADRLASVGLAQRAADILSRAGKVKEAIACCVQLNQWDTALEMAKRERMQDIESVMRDYAQHLVQRGQPLDAAELYRKGKCYADASAVLRDVAAALAKDSAPLLLLKRLHVMAALNLVALRQHLVDDRAATDTKSALEGLLEQDAITSNTHSTVAVWRHAEAYHFLLLAHQQFHAGDAYQALGTAMRATQYDEVLGAQAAYSLAALLALQLGQLKTHSLCLMQLEKGAKSRRNQGDMEALRALAFATFAEHEPKDKQERTVKCPTCGAATPEHKTSCRACGGDIPVCVASGRPITLRHYYTCSVCRHHALPSEVQVRSSCPLCHAPIDLATLSHRTPGA